MGTYTLSGDVGTGVTLTTLGTGYGSPLTITQTGTVSTAGQNGIYSTIQGASLLNQGSITAASGIGVQFMDGGTIANNGIITAADGIEISNALGTVFNTGKITATQNTLVYPQGTGIYLKAGGYVSNIGTAASIIGKYYGIVSKDGPATLLNGGTISVTSRYDNAVLLYGSASVSNIGTASVIAGGGGIAMRGTSSTVLNEGKITGKFSYGVYTAYDGFVSNIGTASNISGSSTGVVVQGDGTILNTGTIASKNGLGIIIGGAGYIANFGTKSVIAAGAGGVYVEGGTGTIFNEGTIRATSSRYGGFLTGALLFEGGTVTNSGTASAISGVYYGVKVAGQQGTVLNEGWITGADSFGIYLNAGGLVTNSGFAAAITGGLEGVTFKYTYGTVINTGTITGTAGFGIYLGDGGTVSNNAGGSIIGGGDGVYTKTAGTILNAGSIAGAQGMGIHLLGGGNVANSITGSIAGLHGGLIVTDGAGIVMNAGNITAPAGDGIYLGAGGSVGNTTSGTITGSYAAGSTPARYAGIYVAGTPGTIVNQGVITGSRVDGINLAAGGTIINAGSIGGGNGTAIYFGGTSDNLLVVDPGAVFTGMVVASGSASNTLELAPGDFTLAGIGSQFTGFGDIDFAPGSTWLVTGNMLGLTEGQTISGFTIGDTIDLTDFAATTASFVTGAGLELGDGTTEVTLALDAPANGYYLVQSDGHGGAEITEDVMCFLEGTHISTPGGEVAVEALRIGDIILTADGGTVPVRWIGIRSVARRFADPLCVLPIRIKAGALGDNLPRRDLLVSPDHAMYLDGILVQASALVDGSSITREYNMPEHFVYYHVETPNHALILAEGAATETFVDNTERLGFDNWAEHEALYGQGIKISEMNHPRAKSARQIPAALHRHLIARATMFGAALLSA